LKPIVDIKDCYIIVDSLGRERLKGIVLNYPDEHKLNFFKDGDIVITSPIVKKNDWNIETQRTNYRVVYWIHDENTKT
jgi:hypothetical protein